MSKHLSPEVRVPIDKENVSIFREESRCIKCGQCRDMCRDYIGVLGTYDLLRTGDRAICINCGQCANVCPVESIREQPEYGMVAAEIMDPEKDSLRFYYLGNRYENKIEHFGVKASYNPEDVLML